MRRRKQRDEPLLVEGSAGLRRVRAPRMSASPPNLMSAAIGRVAAASQLAQFIDAGHFAPLKAQ